MDSESLVFWIIALLLLMILLTKGSKMGRLDKRPSLHQRMDTARLLNERDERYYKEKFKDKNKKSAKENTNVEILTSLIEMGIENNDWNYVKKALAILRKDKI